MPCHAMTVKFQNANAMMTAHVGWWWTYRFKLIPISATSLTHHRTKFKTSTHLSHFWLTFQETLTNTFSAVDRAQYGETQRKTKELLSTWVYTNTHSPQCDGSFKSKVSLYFIYILNIMIPMNSLIMLWAVSTFVHSLLNFPYSIMHEVWAFCSPVQKSFKCLRCCSGFGYI